jgi:hypothetical protein
MKFAIVSSLFFAAYATAASIESSSKKIGDINPGKKDGDINPGKKDGEREGVYIFEYTDNECKDVAVKRFIPKNTSDKCSEDPKNCIKVDGGTSRSLMCGIEGIRDSSDEYVMRDHYRTEDCTGKVVQTIYYPRIKEGMCVATGGESNIERFFKIDGDKISIGATDCKNTIQYTKNKCNRFAIIRWD